MTLEELKPHIIEIFAKRYSRKTPRKPNETNLVTYVRAKCILDGCNNETLTQVSKLNKVSGKCSSCASKKRPYEWAFSQVIYRNKEDRFVGSAMTYRELLELMKQDRCSYCGTSITRLPHIVYDTKPALLLDRKDSNKGYIFDNCVTCCWRCNEMKSNYYSYEEFKAIMELLKLKFGW
jgi:hypothetical protein